MTNKSRVVQNKYKNGTGLKLKELILKENEIVTVFIYTNNGKIKPCLTMTKGINGVVISEKQLKRESQGIIKDKTF